MTILSHEKVMFSNSKKPAQWIFFVHGFLGSGANWRTFARRLVEQKPDFGAVLVDLRMHGHSQNFSPPHGIFEAAYDLVKLTQEFDAPVCAVLGHSFGGKVALKFVEYFHDLKTAWLIDFMPWALVQKTSASSTYLILSILEPLVTKTFSSRQAFIHILESAGLDRPTSQWLAMNLENASHDQLQLRMNYHALRSLLDDYFKQDLVHILENKNIKTKINFALGNKSTMLNNIDRERIISITNNNPNHIHTYLIKNAGHYVHIDALEKLLALVTASLDYKII